MEAFTCQRNTEVFFAVRWFWMSTWLFRTGLSVDLREIRHTAVLAAYVRDKPSLLRYCDLSRLLLPSPYFFLFEPIKSAE